MANPTTDQYLAAAKKIDNDHTGCPQPCPTQALESIWIDALARTLPDVDRAVIGQVLLHAGQQMPSLSIGLALCGFNPLALPAAIGDTLSIVGAGLLTAAPGTDAQTGV